MHDREVNMFSRRELFKRAAVAAGLILFDASCSRTVKEAPQPAVSVDLDTLRGNLNEYVGREIITEGYAFIDGVGGSESGEDGKKVAHLYASLYSGNEKPTPHRDMIFVDFGVSNENLEIPSQPLTPGNKIEGEEVTMLDNAYIQVRGVITERKVPIILANSQGFFAPEVPGGPMPTPTEVSGYFITNIETFIATPPPQLPPYAPVS